MRIGLDVIDSEEVVRDCTRICGEMETLGKVQARLFIHDHVQSEAV